MRGSRFDLTYSPTRVNFTGRERFATAVAGFVPAPGLRCGKADTVTNHPAEDTSIHWHGMILPGSQDGVPHV